MSKNKWDRETVSAPVETPAKNTPPLTKLEYFTGLAFHALIVHGMTPSAIPNMAIDRAKNLLERLSEECQDTSLDS